MILTIFAVLAILAVIAVGLGITTREPYFTFVGLFFLFNLGIVLFTGALEIPTGDIITTSYNYVNGTLNNTTSVVSDTYTNFAKLEAHWYGLLLAITTGFGAFVLFWDLRNGYEDRKEAEK